MVLAIKLRFSVPTRNSMKDMNTCQPMPYIYTGALSVRISLDTRDLGPRPPRSLCQTIGQKLQFPWDQDFSGPLQIYTGENYHVQLSESSIQKLDAMIKFYSGFGEDE